MTPRLLVIDDDPEITSALVRGLTLHGYHAEAENRADRALERLCSGEFSAAIVDVMLGADSGIDLVRRIREAQVTLPVLMLSALSDVEDRAAGLAAGADDYVVKPFHFDELVARLRVQEHRAKSERLQPPRLDPETRTLGDANATVTLTEREYDLLELLTVNAGAPLPRGEIFDTLWAGDGSGNENVVDVYIGYLRKKLAESEFQFEIKTIRNQGFCVTGLVPVIEQPPVSTKV
ncbi:MULTISPECIES: response regulator transcription factor [unclassified Roseovarius]|uniref:response regulator transcription factor n=1 Tax=unclassified Roseovarius TaxID=2614913 RepID=UPI00273FEB49|nr:MULTISPECIES: response regulator transcription factor [unclassified Roseovarius]